MVHKRIIIITVFIIHWKVRYNCNEKIVKTTVQGYTEEKRQKKNQRR